MDQIQGLGQVESHHFARCGNMARTLFDQPSVTNDLLIRWSTTLPPFSFLERRHQEELLSVYTMDQYIGFHQEKLV